MRRVEEIWSCCSKKSLRCRLSLVMDKGLVGVDRITVGGSGCRIAEVHRGFS